MNELEIGAKLDQLPISKWHWQIFLLIGFGLQVNGFLNSAGNTILADLVSKGWSNNFYNALFSSGMMLGFFGGSIIGGVLGDKFGRKKAYQLSMLTFAIFSCLSGFACSIHFLIFFRMMMGLGMGSGIVIGYATFTEFMPAKVRGTWSARISLVGNFSPLIAALASYLIIPKFGWRMMYFIGSFASFFMLALVTKYLDESPRWCIQKGKNQQGEEILNKTIEKIEKEKKQQLTFASLPKTAKKKSKFEVISFRSFFKGDLGRRTLVATTVLIAMNISLYTITVWLPTIFVQSGIDLSKSLFMTTIMMIGAPLGVFVSSIIIDQFPRKWLGVCLIITISLLGYIYSLQTSEWRIVLIGGMLIFILYIYNSFSSAVYAPEIWPTETKMRGSGISNSIGRIVAICMPYLIAWLLTNYSVTAVFIVLGFLLGTCAIVLAFFGIETRGKSVEEIANKTTNPSALYENELLKNMQ